ncbi:SLAM family member 5-like [Puntigrus tetrazona]|uniref:SLAM family member 5-like n=1 Tax=Puntigrus tetrazona TaxID=1606681 RepID=UPI001C88E6BB|nr:SLAM family member 5-like [Puntigrus tetrazona]
MFLLCFCWWHLLGVFGAATNETQSVSVTEGDSVILTGNATEIHENDDLLLTFGTLKSLIDRIKKPKPNSTYAGTDERFRDRLKLDHQTGSLTIMNITTQHAGVYEVQISGKKLLTKVFNVSVYARLPVPVVSSNSSNCSSSSSSSSCSLLCSAVNMGHVTLSWYKGNSLLSSISVSDLSISLSLPLEVEHQDKNTYSCVINNPIRNQTTHLDISQLCRPNPDQGLPLFHKVLVSAAAGSLLIVAAVVMYSKKCRKIDREDQTCEEMIIYAEPTLHKRKTQLKIKEETQVEYASVAIRR